MIKSELSVINFCGNPFYFRDGTSDALIMQLNLLSPDIEKREYLFPKEIQSKVILDIGANIGATALLLDHCYPGARIFAFEPDLENFSILEKNVENYPNITPLNFGLADFDGEVVFYNSADNVNFGGLSMYSDGSGEERCSIEVKNALTVMQTLGVDKIDLIKIDCEGAEYPILKALEPFLSQVQWIEGELHGQDDFKLLELLEKDFNLSFKKELFQRNWNFRALTKGFILP